jgi:hypothetical protein
MKLGGSVLYLKLLNKLISNITLKCNVCETDFDNWSNSGQQAALPVVGKTGGALPEQ